MYCILQCVKFVNSVLFTNFTYTFKNRTMYSSMYNFTHFKI